MIKEEQNQSLAICIVGLGYVGLPLAVEFSKHFKTTGFDINKNRVNEISLGKDRTNEIDELTLKSCLSENPEKGKGLKVVYDSEYIKECNFYIITVPTPVDKNMQPDLRPLIKASEEIGKILKPGDYVVYESTVYPGATEEICLPILEKYSSLELNKDFFIGYSPERINPGDKLHTVSKIQKVTSGSNEHASRHIDSIYAKVITAGTFRAISIKVAEAAKVIENTQRDINIAFVNELSKICQLLQISVYDVLDAAATKWNFLKFQPGLVGGHCIGVDPYYLAQKAQQLGYYPEIILSGRRLNEGMGQHLADTFIKALIKNGVKLLNAKVLVLGITFKENCPDIRNSGVINVISRLKDFELDVEIHDPFADSKEVFDEYNLELTENLSNDYDGIFIAVAHRQFVDIDILKLTNSKNPVVFDIKNVSTYPHRQTL
ncbi:MAG: nucleotide sugar dehydrogenase [Flavobacteriaceae bacterium]|nr:nucleotide sugar dehydrogenase [Flavobacteriaceae bacterium]